MEASLAKPVAGLDYSTGKMPRWVKIGQKVLVIGENRYPLVLSLSKVGALQWQLNTLNDGAKTFVVADITKIESAISGVDYPTILIQITKKWF